jgi:O-antigen ligase
MIKKETAYIIFKALWVYLLLATVADLKLHTKIDLIPSIHVSEIPFIKYIPFLIAVFIVIPFREFTNVFRKKENVIIIGLLSLLLLVSLASSYYSSFPETAFRLTSRFFFYFLVLIAAITACSYFEDAYSFLIKSFIYVNVLVIICSMLDFYVPAFHQLLVDHFDRPETKHSVMKIGGVVYMRPMGILTDTNLTAFSVGFSLMLLLLNHKHFNKIFTYIFFAAGSYVFGMLASRASLLMCIAAAAYFFFTKIVDRKELMIFLILFTVFQVITPQTYYRIITTGDTEKIENESRFGRLVIWKAAFNLFTENPLLGVGPGNFFEHSQLMIREVVFLENPGINIDHPNSKDFHQVGKGNPHNVFLAVLCETGVVGFIIFLAFIGYIFYIYLKQKKYISLIFFLLILMVSSVSNFAPYYRFYLLICIIFYAASAKNLLIGQPAEKTNK